jgi:hypothetical protein
MISGKIIGEADCIAIPEAWIAAARQASKRRVSGKMKTGIGKIGMFTNANIMLDVTKKCAIIRIRLMAQCVINRWLMTGYNGFVIFDGNGFRCGGF